ncbi:MAG TPA: TonB-dependent receptor [Cytophagaceae bacterium]
MTNYTKLIKNVIYLPLSRYLRRLLLRKKYIKVYVPAAGYRKATVALGFMVLTLPALGQDEITADTLRSDSSINVIQPLTNEVATISISGIVRDSVTSSPLAGAVVVIDGTEDGALTDSLGGFEISTSKELPLQLIVSYDGGAPKHIPVNQLPVGPIEILYPAVAPQTQQIVVVGYGTSTKKDLIGSITKVSLEESKNIPEASFDSQMQGKAAGVQINTNTGVPGSDVFIRVRGTTSINASNEPLYIIDGVFVNTNSLQGLAQERKTSPIADINPADIESIEILKDAAAIAIYGSRGANGVIIVTTKRGEYGQKPKIEFNTSQGWAWAPKNRIWKTTTGEEHALLVNEYNANMGKPLPFRPISEGGRGLPSEQPTYDRMSILNRTARLKNYDLSISGGSKDTRYYIGGGYTNQEAIWKPMSFERASFKVNIDQKLNRKISIGTSNTLSRSFRNQARPANGGNGTLLQASLNIPTYLPIFLEDGTPAKWVNFDNIVVLTEKVNIKSTSNHYIGNFYVDANVLKNLKFRSSWSVDFNMLDEEEYWDTKTLLGAPPTNGRATSSKTQASTWINEQTLRYSKKIAGKHTIGLLGGNTLQGTIISNTTAGGTNFPNNSYTQISAAANQTASQWWTKSTLASFFTRADYNFRGKYYVEATVRADGSSRFGVNNRWAYFPSIGAAWRIKEERFLSNVNFLSNLKLKASYGSTGNQAGINDFASYGLWNAGYSYPDNTTGGERPGTAPLQLANPNLKWETTTQSNAGIEAGFFDNRLNVEFNVYRKYTKDLLLQVAVPTSTGFSSYLTNFGEMSNTGFEFSISSTNIKTKQFSWNTEFNVARNNNLIEKIPNPIQYAGRNLIRLEEGQPLYSYWLYNQLYVDPQTGDAVFEDVNNDGKITAEDRKIVGNTWPKFFGGITNSFSFKGFDVNALLTFSYGNKVWNHNRMLGETGGTLDANRVLLASQLDRWTTPGQITDVPKLTAENYSRQENSRFLEDGSFIRLRSLSLGYTVPKSAVSKLKVEKLRFYAMASNLFIITKYKGADPETNLGGDQNIQGYDYAIPPQPKSIQLGMNLVF